MDRSNEYVQVKTPRQSITEEFDFERKETAVDEVHPEALGRMTDDIALESGNNTGIMPIADQITPKRTKRCPQFRFIFTMITINIIIFIIEM